MQRAWLVVPALAVIAGAAALAVGRSPEAAMSLALLGAGLAAALRALDGDGPAAVAGNAIGALVAVATLLGHDHPRQVLAAAAAAWTIAELARAGVHSPLVAMLPACVAGVLDPSYVALIAIAGARLVTAPWQRPRFIALVPAAGALATLLALLAVTGRIDSLFHAWTGTSAHPISFATLAQHLGDALGPISAVAALAGLAFVAGRSRYTQVAIAACVAGGLLVALRGAPPIAVVAMAGLAAGLAVTRLAATIRLASGQAITGATVGLLLILPPVWSTIERLAR